MTLQRLSLFLQLLLQQGLKKLDFDALAPGIRFFLQMLMQQLRSQGDRQIAAGRRRGGRGGGRRDEQGGGGGRGRERGGRQGRR